MSFANFIEACKNNDKINVTHVLCSDKNNILAEYVKPPYEMNSLKLFFSMTKSITSLAIGIAVDKNMVNLDDKIVDFFTEELPIKPHENLKKITIKDLLTMSSGIHDNTYSDLFVKSDWVCAFLEQDFPHEPGTFYRYSTHGSHMLSAIITKVSSLSLEDFLNKHLFYPMGIYEAQWELSPEKYTAGGMGLSLYPHSLVKISQLLLNNGIYNNKQLISTEYLALATTQQILKQDEINKSDNYYSGYQYGFQIHVGKDGNYRFDGAFGQLCLICPQKNISIVVFSNNSKTETLLSLIYIYLLDDCIFDKDNNLTQLNELDFKDFILPSNSLYSMKNNKLGIKSVYICKRENNYKILLEYDGYENTIEFSFQHHTQGKITFIKDLNYHIQKYVCFASTIEQTVSLNVYLIEAPYVVTYTFTINDNILQMEFSINNSFTLKNEVLTGTLILSK